MTEPTHTRCDACAHIYQGLYEGYDLTKQRLSEKIRERRCWRITWCCDRVAIAMASHLAMLQDNIEYMDNQIHCKHTMHVKYKDGDIMSADEMSEIIRTAVGSRSVPPPEKKEVKEDKSQ